jgi:hypothetical protein
MKRITRYLLTTLVAIFSMLLCATAARAQADSALKAQLVPPDSAHAQIITLRDGSTVFGRVVVLSGDSLTFQSTAGATMQLHVGAVRSIKEIATAEIHEGEYWFPNPNATRLFFAPTGQMLKKGEGYLSDYEVFFPGVAVGISDNLTLGGGVSLLPLGFEDQIYYFTPKIGVSLSDKFHVAAGMLLAGGMGGVGGVGGIYYGVGTFGDGNASFTVGAGYGFAGGDIESRPVGLVGGEVRLSKRIGFVTENYLLPVSQDNILYSFGLRFMGEKLTTDLALFNISGSNSIGFPFVDFVFRF